MFLMLKMIRKICGIIKDYTMYNIIPIGDIIISTVRYIMTLLICCFRRHKSVCDI